MQGAGTGGWVEKCPEESAKVLEQVRRAEKGPEVPYMLFLAGAQTPSDLHMGALLEVNAVHKEA